MLEFASYSIDKKIVEDPHIMVSNILEPIDDSVIFIYHLAEFPGCDQGIMLTLYYFDVDSLGELLYVNLMRLPKWLIGYIESGHNVSVTDRSKNITIELTPQIRELV